MHMNDLYLQQMKSLLGNEYDEYIRLLDEKPQRGFRVNTLKTSADRLFSVMDIHAHKSIFSDNGYILESDESLGNTPGHRAGLFYMQEPSASSAVTVLNPEKGMKILDLCAAPGSKSTQIAEKLGNTGFLAVNEFNRSRAQILLENIERHGSANVMVLNNDTADVAAAFKEYFDAVLCDAPCSGEGMFRKEEDAVTCWSTDNVRLCAARQQEILENAYRCLKPGGVLVYSTCTFNLNENEEVIRNFLSVHDNMCMEDAGVDFGRRGYIHEFDIDRAVRIFPMDQGEGHFIARMRKSENNSSVHIKMMNESKIPACAAEFLDGMLVKQYPYYYTAKDRVYGSSTPMPLLKGCHLIRAGVYIGDVIKGRFEPSHHFFMSSWSPFRNTVELNDEEVLKYFHGEQINKSVTKGWYAVTWNGYSVGGVKSDGRNLKNRYPKQLRLR